MHDPLPPLNPLRSFILVATHGSLAAAASMLNITQPAVSKRIRLLENYLGVQLLNRGANTITLNAAGKQYAAEISKAFRGIEDATGALKKELTGPLRIRCYTTWASRWLIPRLPRFKEEHPNCEIEIRASVEPVDFARDDVAAAVWSAGEEPPTENSGRLQSICIAPFAIPHVAETHGQNWISATLLSSKNRPADWTTWSRATCIKLTGPTLVIETTSLAVDIALRGMGVVIASKFMVMDEIRQGRLVQLGPLVDSGSRYWLTLPPKVQRPETIVFRDWLTREVREEERGESAEPVFRLQAAKSPDPANTA
ncbi:LysR family transcriptional regulator [Chelativorans sp. AA-79]|uniref:LysR family transcriptional regulator n=1 Tax=Chelativorans sp. AA-79 TaxID=3028735 RepID=UPI0023F9AFE0|nr:LysR family transcriptional regulator [Chelativorans sp. AA-79]WEX12445.1 LysR family transcriptional regulator [Chelativorans sp. AA-79]